MYSFKYFSYLYGAEKCMSIYHNKQKIDKIKEVQPKPFNFINYLLQLIR